MADEGFTSDPALTAMRRRQLAAYYAKNVLAIDRFRCKHVAECKASAIRPGVEFFEGQLSYVGTHYDLTQDGTAFRVLVVPMEVGQGPAHVSMAARDEQVRVRIDQSFGSRNGHMRGVALALRLAFGRTVGDDRAGEMLMTQSGPVHVFDAFAMANLLLCSAAASGKKSRHTPTMRANCLVHLGATISILEPTLVISQGATLQHDLERFFRAFPRGDRVWTGSVGDTRFAWVALHHPTYNWEWLSRPYLRETVIPAIGRGRELALGISGERART